MATEIDELITKLSYEDNSKTIEEAEKRVDDLSKSNEKAAETTDKLSDEQLKLAQQLQDTKERADRLKTEQIELRKQMAAAGGGSKEQKNRLKELNRALENSDLKTKKLQNASKRLGLEKRKASQATRKLTKDQRKLQAALRKTTREAKKETSALGKFGARVSTIVTGLAIRDFGRDIIAIFTSAATAVAGLVPEFTGVADAIGKTSKALGIGSDDLQRLRFAGERSGVAVGTMDKSLAKLTKGLEDARVTGTGPVADAFDTLGLSVNRFQRLGTEQRVGLIADAMKKLDSPTQKSAIAMTLFGGKAKEMAVLLDEGSEGIKALGDRAEELGGVIDSSAIVSAERLADAFLDVETFAGGLKNTLAAELAPFIEKSTQGMLAWVEQNQELIDQGLDAVVGGLSSVFQILGEIIAAIPVEQLVALMIDMIDVFSSLTERMAETATEGDSFMGMLLDMLVALVKVVASAVELLEAFDTMGDDLPELPGLFDAIVWVLKLAVELFVFLLGVLSDLLGLLKPVIEALGDLVSTIVDAINPLGSLAGMLKDVSGGMVDFTSDTADLNAELENTESAALGAVTALQKLASASSGRKGAFGVTEQQSDAESAQQDRQDKENKKKEARAKIVLEDAGNLSDTQLQALSTDTSLSEKTREKAAKALRKNQRKTKKKGKAKSQNTLTETIDKEIAARAQEAGARKAARAQQAGETSRKELNRIELTERREVEERLTTRFAETGELPAGIRSDISQIARTPGLEAAGGRVAPPVISIVNNRINGVQITIETNVENAGANASQIAAANVNAFRGITNRDLGDAILNAQTQERR